MSQQRAQCRPLHRPQAPHQTPLPLTQGGLQQPAPRCAAGRLTGFRRQEDPQARRAAPAPWSVLGVRKCQHLGRQQDQSHGHHGTRGDGAAKREHQQCHQEAVLLRDHLQPRELRQLRLPWDRRAPLELPLHQLAHVCARADHVREPGGVEAHPHQRGLRVRVESQVVAAVRTSANGHSAVEIQARLFFSQRLSHIVHKVNYSYSRIQRVRTACTLTSSGSNSI